MNKIAEEKGGRRVGMTFTVPSWVSYLLFDAISYMCCFLLLIGLSFLVFIEKLRRKEVPHIYARSMKIQWEWWLNLATRICSSLSRGTGSGQRLRWTENKSLNFLFISIYLHHEGVRWRRGSISLLSVCSTFKKFLTALPQPWTDMGGHCRRGGARFHDEVEAAQTPHLEEAYFWEGSGVRIQPGAAAERLLSKMNFPLKRFY